MVVHRALLTRQGLVTEEWQAEKAEPVRSTLRPRSFAELAPFFDANVDLADDVRLADLLDLLDIGPDLVLLEVIVGDPIRPFMDEYRSTVRGEPVAGTVARLVVRNAFSAEVTADGDTRYTVGRTVSGEHADGASMPIELRTIADLAGARLVYDPMTALYRNDDDVRLGLAPRAVVQWSLSLLDLIKAVFWELALQGTPDERNAVRAALPPEVFAA